MTTPSQAAFETTCFQRMNFSKDDKGYNSLQTATEWERFDIGFIAGIAYGRKQALEEAIAICNAMCDPNSTDHGNGYNQGAIDCENKIKELMK